MKGIHTSETVSAILKRKNFDYPSIAEPVLTVSAASVVQLRPEPAPTNLAIFSSKRISVLGLQHHGASVGMIIMKPVYFGFMWWDGSDDCLINGELARCTAIYTQGLQVDFHAAGGVRRT